MMLLVEDNEAHAELIIRTLRNHNVINQVYHVTDGEQALDFLYRRGAYSELESGQPHVILLDLRLPKIDGLEVLQTIKQDEQLRRIPVVILSTSEAERDVARAYYQHANSYLVKPISFQRFAEMMRDLGFYWLIWNKNPLVE